tara:strand:+ start:50 stop:523 length:474 start_codon:yes stop_codon:yes gene_type:complete
MNTLDFLTANKNTDICGVYLLLDKGSVVYVGSSDYIPSRVYSHTLSEKVFDSVDYICCERDKKASLEALTIIKHNPKYNLELPSGDSYTTLNWCLSASKSELNNLIKEIPVEFMRSSKCYLKIENYRRLKEAMVVACKKELKIMNDEFMTAYKKECK